MGNFLNVFIIVSLLAFIGVFYITCWWLRMVINRSINRGDPKEIKEYKKIGLIIFDSMRLFL
ncbi:hypothetical protein JOD45_001304 [Scopulibacillus daqui]|uniref:Uncharacterized protein n=1 Tax=Scopulibacillus daqui TaxID=1469162 RepID=A0ABS2PYG3_9BACL|nr:hypothetical protein [Scopulibacillus daqui]MBM7645093.1 hypothetical protein [Scopulibacillus daqui]